ncbi:unnamed protein product [Amoebophrya sp. A25]|nr:unnamed protein product [Amoebophrya sp. A25]|eukprot:GSA25T00010787001.1
MSSDSVVAVFARQIFERTTSSPNKKMQTSRPFFALSTSSIFPRSGEGCCSNLKMTPIFMSSILLGVPATRLVPFALDVDDIERVIVNMGSSSLVSISKFENEKQNYT